MELSPKMLGRASSSMESLNIALVFASLFIAYIVFNRKFRKDDRKHPPFAPGGVWEHTRSRITNQNPYWMLDVASTMRTRVFQFYLPSLTRRSIVIVGETDAFRAILMDPRTKKPEKLYGYFRSVYGGTPTAFTMNGPGWHAKRRAFAPAFSSNHVKRMTTVALEKSDVWIRDVLLNQTKDDSFDVGKEMIDIVLSALSETAFEYEMSGKEKTLFGDELKLALVEFTRKAPLIPFRSLFGWFIPSRRRAIAASSRLKALVLNIMKEYRAKEPSNKGTLIQLIMESEAFPTEDEKAAQLLEFLIAGHDTTAYGIAFILIELARNPDEQTKLRESLTQMPPEKWTTSEYLQRVVKEGMRLHPVGRSIRITGRDTVTDKHERLPKGSLCVAHFLMLFRNPDIFDEPESFLPSRWENPSREMLNAFNPFSLGRQNCVGQSLARAETFSIVARICSEFELSVECDGYVEHALSVKPVGARLRARKV